jgi:hypothetical protein
MKTFEVKGIKVHVEDEEMAKSLLESERKPEPEPEPEVDEKDAEVLLKELEEWLAVGRSQVLNKAQKELRKQWVGIGDAAPQVPRGAGVVGPQAASTGIVAAPNIPSWLSGVPQAQAAAQQIAIGSLIEAVVGQLAPVLEEFAAKLAEWVSTVAEGLFRTISEVAERMAEAHEKLGEKLTEVSEKLEAVAEKLPEGVGEAPLPEALPEVPPVEEVPPAAEEAAPPAEGVGGEEAPPAEAGAGEEAPTPPPAEAEEEAKSIAAPTAPELVSDVPAALFSPQFLAAFARHLSQMTKEVLETQTRKAQTEPQTVKPQSALEIADVIASTFRKSRQTKGKVETDLTTPVETAAAPESEGAKVADQVKGAAKDDTVRKPLEEAGKAAKKGGD